jgi:hypothetical protein
MMHERSCGKRLGMGWDGLNIYKCCKNQGISSSEREGFVPLTLG